MPSARSTNNSFLDALAITLASAVVITERIVVPTLLLSLKLLEALISQQEKPENVPMKELEIKTQDYAYIEAPISEETPPKTFAP
jgi:hypothetical protein